MNALFRRLSALLAALVLAACASGPPGSGLTGEGTVNSITEVSQASTGASVAGSIGGALLGGWLGSNIGGGSGQVIATTVGATAGSVAGSTAAGQASAVTAWDVSVRFEDGIDRIVRVMQPPAFRPGARVRVANGTVTPL